MPLVYETLKNWSIAPIEQAFTARDTMLYALGVGAGQPSDVSAGELQYIYGPELRALPTMATVLGNDPMWMRAPGTGIDWRNVVHGEQFLKIHKPLPAAGRIVGRAKVDEIYDKGAGKGAVLFYSFGIHDAADDSLYATVALSAFIRGQGGFGGPATGAPRPQALPEDREPDFKLTLTTRPEQAALYRLSGDDNPMHVDPAAAAEAGFRQPILHGLCAYGMAGRGIVGLLCGHRPERLRVLNLRFTDLIYPGETLALEVWTLGAGAAAFRVRIVERGVIALSNGYAEFEA
ncbi:MAG: 3-alpha,7-alpha, 12-alpha-trihydroxy-5-beta-cholest-24-enoyl-CoA hydratase [Hydrocarboniphaga sp.]|uniref:MaoC/PaaZ C-terminal domain-containing protein n=1 Tax=Hydrocarboniphaga sp. TaxID=2033016 RepID=UPI002615A129|nr:MaoC/PaaZ C-terminal domain-containing protein [Hydrocarboniphaga sp.]MDB5971421.1 3-alpha,7-alpha, 12-alpha-trihydroxy-5-beta-cholest-24-enoyl-CoA hydratase [Hydrocarboniphaga sp.]